MQNRGLLMPFGQQFKSRKMEKNLQEFVKAMNQMASLLTRQKNIIHQLSRPSNMTAR
jgi:hypothetical protein